LWDDLRFDAAPAPSFTACGLPSPRGSANLCVRAYRLLKERTGTKKEAAMRLVKRIPAGSGLGGGSADAAACLAGLNRLWRLGLAPSGLRALAAKLGSDVPYFLLGGAALGRGRGERLVPLTSRLRAWAILLKPAFSMPTREAYRALDRSGNRNAPGVRPGDVIPALRAGLLGSLSAYNDFEAVVGVLHPKIKSMRSALLELGARPVFMTGSGSAMIGLVESPADAKRIAGTLGRRMKATALAVPVAPFGLRLETV
jgi:4-diphosphocytidyl-2-C-methyl-D-erythritol kinase